MNTKELYEHHYRQKLLDRKLLPEEDHFKPILLHKQILSDEDSQLLCEEFDHEWQLFDEECLNLIPEGESESRLESALKRLDEIQPSRNEEDRTYLKVTVIDICFTAFCEKRRVGEDFSEKSRKIHKVLLKKIPEALKAIKTLKDFSKEFYEAENNTSILGDEITVNNLDKSQKVLEDIRDNKDSPISSKQRFLLSYPNPIVKQQETEAPEVNWLLFALVFLIRNFCDPRLKNGEWGENRSGEMPSADPPFYFSIVADICNAVIKLRGTERFDYNKVRYRIRNLIKDAYL